MLQQCSTSLAPRATATSTGVPLSSSSAPLPSAAMSDQLRVEPEASAAPAVVDLKSAIARHSLRSKGASLSHCLHGVGGAGDQESSTMRCRSMQPESARLLRPRPHNGSRQRASISPALLKSRRVIAGLASQAVTGNHRDLLRMRRQHTAKEATSRSNEAIEDWQRCSVSGPHAWHRTRAIYLAICRH